MSENKGSFLFAASVMVVVLLLIGILTWRVAAGTPPWNVATPSPSAELLVSQAPSSSGFQISAVPNWLFVHVGIIAGLQVLSILLAAAKAAKEDLSRRDCAMINFLVDVPMFLGLFGTLMGVCLTQFISGTLVAPLAYLTTMSGILLHLFGKFTVAIPASTAELIEEY